jgi:cyanophycin synthetase
VILKEDDNRRGRQQGEVAGLLEQGLIQGGLQREKIETVFAEPEAIARALGMMQDGDLVVVLVDDVSTVLRRVRARSSG